MPFKYQEEIYFLQPSDTVGQPDFTLPVAGVVGYCPMDESIDGGLFTINYTAIPQEDTMGYCPQDESIDGGLFTITQDPT